jgi:hypothetical protein
MPWPIVQIAPDLFPRRPRRGTLQTSMAGGNQQLVLRCAWCGRYRSGDLWLELGEDDAPDPGRISHGICADCLAGLRDCGDSK